MYPLVLASTSPHTDAFRCISHVGSRSTFLLSSPTLRLAREFPRLHSRSRPWSGCTIRHERPCTERPPGAFRQLLCTWRTVACELTRLQRSVAHREMWQREFWPKMHKTIKFICGVVNPVLSLACGKCTRTYSNEYRQAEDRAAQHSRVLYPVSRASFVNTYRNA